MKSTFIKPFFVIFLLLVTSNLILAEDVERIFKVNKNNTLEILVNFGNVNVFTWDKDELKVLAKNVNGEELNKLTIEQKGSVVTAQFKGEDSKKFSLDVWIPSHFNLNAATGGGNVKINDMLNGKVSVSSAGGNISTSKINGMVELSTSGGNITCDDIDGNLEVSSGGGDIKLSTVTGVADVSTAGGNITVGKVQKSADISTAGGNITVIDIGGNADISTAGGNINVGYVYGTADISTGGGNITVSGSKGMIDVSTGGGNITLKNIGGGVEAATGAGRISAELSTNFNQNSSISTAAGDIILTVPESIKATVLATVKSAFMDKLSDYIKSDFTGLENVLEGGKKGGTAKLLLNGGGPTIKVETHLGKIEIKKK